MVSKLIRALKNEMQIKDIITWFILSFLCVLFVYLFIVKRSFHILLFIEVLGFSIIFVLMMIGTKAYGYFLDGYYQSYIDRQNKKQKK